MGEPFDFIVSRNDLRRTQFVPGRQGEDSALEEGQLLLRVDRFGLTANNITYGVVGDAIGYWDFFPAREGWGRIPVWGFADVARSRHAALPEGERLFGYLPISSHVLLQADQVTRSGLVDASPHRAGLPPIYNLYYRVAADPSYAPEQENQAALFRPLYSTSFLLDDFLAEADFFGARTIILSGASSKTALGLAFFLSLNRRERCDVIGLTSPANADFVARTGTYTAVHAYDQVRSLSTDAPAVLVDFTGSAPIVGAVHEHLGEALRYSCQVGITHWEETAGGAALPGPAPVFFFAPDQARKRREELGASELQRRLAIARDQFAASSAAWLRIVEHRGRAGVESAYRAMVEGRIDPAEGHIVSLRD